MTHITFSLVFPLHLAFLYAFRREPIANYIDALRQVIAEEMGEQGDASWREISGRWSIKVSWLTVLISIPALSWFVAVVFTSAIDVTAIYATSSFHAYFFSMILLKTPLSRTTVASIALASAGVIVISFAGSGEQTEDGQGPRNRGLGDLMMMLGKVVSFSRSRSWLMFPRPAGAIVLGLYEVVYKMALPEGQGGASTESSNSSISYTALPSINNITDPELTPPQSRSDTPLPDDRPRGPYAKPRGPDFIPLSPSKLSHDRLLSSTPLLRTKTPPSPSPSYSSPQPSPSKVPHLPTALHADFLTSCIGLATVVLLWVPILILDLLGWETFRMPSISVCGDLMVISWGGALYVRVQIPYPERSLLNHS